MQFAMTLDPVALAHLVTAITLLYSTLKGPRR